MVQALQSVKRMASLQTRGGQKGGENTVNRAREGLVADSLKVLFGTKTREEMFETVLFLEFPTLRGRANTRLQGPYVRLTISGGGRE